MPGFEGAGRRGGSQRTDSEGTDMLTFLMVVVVSWAHTYVKTYQIIYFKCVQFIVC